MKIIIKLATLFFSFIMLNPIFCQGIRQKGGPYYEKAYNAYFTEQNDKLALELINIANQNDPNYGGWDFTFPKGVAIPYEITFIGYEDFESITLLEMNVINDKIIKFKNIPIN